MKQLLLITILLLTGYNPDNLLNRFKMPTGFHHVEVKEDSFGAWLQHLPLMPAGTSTKTYKGDIARTDVYTAAVVDMSVGKQDLQQCADAVMRLRAEYLFSKKQYQSISFNFTSGFKCDYLHYANGYRYQHDRWVLKAKKDFSYPTFLDYMSLVFSYAGTLSLEKELKPVTNIDNLKAGDVFIHGGSPGHCFIIMDVIEDSQYKKKFLLAQSFMPAQNIQILQADGSPWFSMERHSSIIYGELITPEHLRKFE